MKYFALSFIIFCLVLPANAQKSSLQGFVTDAYTSENIIGANVFLEDLSHGVSTDQKGYFNIITELPVKLFVSCIGYADTCFIVNKADGKLLQIKLKPSVQMLQSAEIVASRVDKRTEFNKITLTQRDIELLPTIGSRPDIIKAAQQLPGIEPLTEASSVMLVRGGGPGENLYMLDNVPIIYVNHIGGFMSVFNPEMINSMDIYKGGFPARYGGKLSSIVDLTAKKGDPTKLKGSLSAGLTDIAFSVEGPGGLKNSSFIFTGRKTLTELLFLGILGLQKAGGGFDDNNIIYGFHDFHAKYTWNPNAKNNLSLNIYEGDDYLKIWKNTNNQGVTEKNKIGNIWGNLLVSAQWNSAVSSRLFATNTISYTRYRLRKNTSAYSQTPIDTSDFKSQGKSSVHDFSLRSQWKYTLMQGWSLDFGAQLSNIRYMPNYYYNDNITTNPDKDVSSVFDNAIYLDNVFKAGRILDGTIGARLNYYINKDFKNLSFEPRLNLNLHFGGSTVNLTAMRVAQNSHLLMTPGSVLNNEIWIPAEKGIAPSTSDQISVGWQRGFAQVCGRDATSRLSRLSLTKSGSDTLSISLHENV